MHVAEGYGLRYQPPNACPSTEIYSIKFDALGERSPTNWLVLSWLSYLCLLAMSFSVEFDISFAHCTFFFCFFFHFFLPFLLFHSLFQ